MPGSTSLARRIADIVATRPSQPFLRFLDRGEIETARLSYGELDVRARAIAVALLESIAPGDRLLLVFEPGHEFSEALVGCFYAGIVAVPAPAPRAGASLERLEGIAAAAGAAALLATRAVTEAIEALTAAQGRLGGIRLMALEALGTAGADGPLPGLELAAETTVMIQYTSGSTLEPRGVVLSSACLGANVDWICRSLGFVPGERDEVFVNWMPHYHDMGLIGGIVLPLVHGFETVQMAPLAFVQQPGRWLQAISRYRGTMSGGPPLGYDACVARVPEVLVDSLDLSSWRTAFCGAEPVFTRTLAAFRRRFGRAGLPDRALFCVYGLAEISVYAGGSHPDDDRWLDAADATERAPCFLDEESRDFLRIVAADGSALADGEEGEIWLSGPSVGCGYLDDPAATRRTFGNRLVHDDGRLYLRTGDLGTLDGNVLRITGRIKDVMIRNGVNIAAHDVERLATDEHPRLDPNGAAAFQCDDAEGAIVLLLEKPRGEWEETREPDLVRAIRGSIQTALGVAIDHVAFVEPGALPRTTSGKIQRARAREAWRAGSAGSGAAERSATGVTA